MNIKFNNDLKNNQMTLTVKLPKRNLVGEKRILLGWKDIKEIVNNSYKCPKSHSLGECIKKGTRMDNNHDHLLEDVWIFELIPKNKPKQVKVSAAPARSRKKNLKKEDKK